ncbi:hypothetical protein R5E07_003908 [Vibrio vulnificus]|nr:hypothetical protein [Vibrio vulnificus]ELS9097784.1 hypothetical protein [Vibrio vulnificus]
MNIIEIKDLLIEKYGCNEYLEKYLEIVSSDDDVEYTEAHHILPKSIWPEFEDFKLNEWNKVHLSAYNHFLAHYYFSKATDSCWWAVHYMAHISKKCSFKNCSSEELHEIASLYESCRGNFKLSEETKAKMRKPKSAEHVAKMRKPKSEETKLKMSASFSASRKGKPKSEAHKAAMRKAEHWKCYDELFQLWVDNNMPKCGRFRTIAIKNNYPDTSYQSMVIQFNRDIESNPVHPAKSNVVELKATTPKRPKVNQNTLDFLFAA